MRPSRTVATLAAGPLRRFLTAGDAFEMRVFVEIQVDIGMARPANVVLALHMGGVIKRNVAGFRSDALLDVAKAPPLISTSRLADETPWSEALH